MKKNIYISVIAALFAGFTLTACSDFLEAENKTAGGQTADDFFGKDASALLTAAYSSLKNYAFSTDLYSRGTDLYIHTRGKSVSDFDTYTFNTENSTISSLYSNVYRTINLSNGVISYAGADSQLGQEARFLRNYGYYLLTQHFGGVPYITEYINSAETNYPRTPLNEVYSAMIEDLTDLYNNSSLASQSHEGRASKQAVAALLAKHGIGIRNRGHERSEIHVESDVCVIVSIRALIVLAVPVGQPLVSDPGLEYALIHVRGAGIGIRKRHHHGAGKVGHGRPFDLGELPAPFDHIQHAPARRHRMQPKPVRFRLKHRVDLSLDRTMIIFCVIHRERLGDVISRPIFGVPHAEPRVLRPGGDFAFVQLQIHTRRVCSGGNAAAVVGDSVYIEGGRFNMIFGGGNGAVTAANVGLGGIHLNARSGR
jgi:hypothetical protein